MKNHYPGNAGAVLLAQALCLGPASLNGPSVDIGEAQRRWDQHAVLRLAGSYYDGRDGKVAMALDFTE